ncbi:hypothetical protein DPMN_081072 [Dreissena polymorpha]|uniref:Brinker DNA-binding domain-containing protein n=1 Tax=Dreissena polymorpha TaxID=45954 RepID=A0A9D3Y499_DREPO|nr:hypothetical protein DPMN_081072 [Dreissena polymorpha]
MPSKRAYTASFKLKVVEVAEQHEKHYASKQFNVHRKRVQDWCKMNNELLKVPKTAKHMQRGVVVAANCVITFFVTANNGGGGGAFLSYHLTITWWMDRQTDRQTDIPT